VLLDVGGAEIGEALLADDAVDEPGGDDEPAEPERGRERLARRAGVDDPLGLQPLQRADRRPVVAVLGVIVVFDRDRVPAS
jgi:hypothetical protein